MIPLKSLLYEQVKKISLQTAMDGKFFGPVYHGTTSDKREKIGQEGFKIFVGTERSGDVSHGFETGDYHGGIPAPIHNLGFGVYFTTVKAIAKQFSYGTTKGMAIYYLDVPHLEEINFAAPRTMMKWWIENGYDFKITPETTFGGSRTEWGGTRNTLPAIREERLRATINMTNQLKEKYDAVWFKGKTIRRVLDGDQVCVYDPNNIYEMDIKLSRPGEIGSKVKAKVGIDPYGRGEIKIPIGTRGIILKRTDAKKEREEFPNHWSAQHAVEYYYDVLWKPGGRMYQVLDKWIEFV